MLNKIFISLFIVLCISIIISGCIEIPDPPETDDPVIPEEPEPEPEYDLTPGINAKIFNITVSEGKITINWEPVPDAAYYAVSRAGSRLGKYRVLSGKTETSAFIDKKPNPSKYENYYKITARDAFDNVLSCQLISLELKLFGENIRFYDIKYDDMADIANEINYIHDKETLGSVTGSDGRRGEFSSQRFSFFFKPGDYFKKGYSFSLKIGFYTHAGGLGKTPHDTRIMGTIETPAHLSNNNATCTFWRSIENLEIYSGTFRWGVSQAAPARRIKTGSSVSAAFDFNGGYASGGYTGDCYFSRNAGSGSQQQFYARNCFLDRDFSGVVWNKVLQGCNGTVSGSDWNEGGCTTNIKSTPIIREKPFLYLEDGEYKVFVPSLRRDAIGVSWTDTDIGQGISLDLLKDFYIANAKTDNAAAINAALTQGKHIFFTPGRYMLEAPVIVTRPGTILLGTGYATLIPAQGNIYGALYIDDVDNVTAAGLLFDALYSSAYLLCVGGNNANKNHSNAPTLLSDIFLRVGGYSTAAVNADTAALINSSDIIGDHFWVWRADHGSGVGWTSNKSKNGLIVTGDRVTFYGLFVEHFQEYNVLWLGENGRMFFLQNEFPYDPANQAAWRSHSNTVDGWAAYKVANTVDNHTALGLGCYSVFRSGTGAFVENAIEVPNKPGVTIQHACILRLSSTGGIRGIINGAGNGLLDWQGPERIISYNNGMAVTDSPNNTGIQPADEIFTIPANLLP